MYNNICRRFVVLSYTLPEQFPYDSIYHPIKIYTFSIYSTFNYFFSNLYLDYKQWILKGFKLTIVQKNQNYVQQE